MFPFCNLVQNERSAVPFCMLKPSFCMLKPSFCMLKPSFCLLQSAFPGVGRGMCKTKSNLCPGVGHDASGPEVAPHKLTHHPTERWQPNQCYVHPGFIVRLQCAELQ